MSRRNAKTGIAAVRNRLYEDRLERDGPGVRHEVTPLTDVVSIEVDGSSIVIGLLDGNVLRIHDLSEFEASTAANFIARHAPSAG